MIAVTSTVIAGKDMKKLTLHVLAHTQSPKGKSKR